MSYLSCWCYDNLNKFLYLILVSMSSLFTLIVSLLLFINVRYYTLLNFDAIRANHMIITRINNVSQCVCYWYDIAPQEIDIIMSRQLALVSDFSLNNIHNIKQLCVQNAWMSRDNVGFSRIMRQHSHSLHVTVCDRIRATVTRSSHYYTK